MTSEIAKISDLLQCAFLIEDSKTKVISLAPEVYLMIGREIPSNLKSTFLDKRVDELCEKYRALWPAKIQSGSRPVKQGPSAIKAKLKSFLKKNPQYKDEQILAAAAAYVAKMKQKNYEFMICSDYFIEKDKASQLEVYIEQGVTADKIVKASIHERTL
jgi:hypothetical protein